MTKAEFLLEAATLWDQLKEKEETTADFYTYEKDFDEMWVKLGRQTLEGSMTREKTMDRRKKKSIK